MDKLNLDQLMRYGLAGGVALLSTAATYPSELQQRLGSTQAVLISGIAFIIGALGYALHRSLVYPVLYRVLVIALVIFGRAKWSWGLLLPFWPSKTEVTLDRERHSDRQIPSMFSTTEWAAQVHFLYCSSWITFAALWLGSYAQWKADPIARCLVLVFAEIAAIGALIANARLLFHETTPGLPKPKSPIPINSPAVS